MEYSCSITLIKIIKKRKDEKKMSITEYLAMEESETVIEKRIRIIEKNMIREERKALRRKKVYLPTTYGKTTFGSPKTQKFRLIATGREIDIFDDEFSELF